MKNGGKYPKTIIFKIDKCFVGAHLDYDDVIYYLSNDGNILSEIASMQSLTVVVIRAIHWTS